MKKKNIHAKQHTKGERQWKVTVKKMQGTMISEEKKRVENNYEKERK